MEGREPSAFASLALGVREGLPHHAAGRLLEASRCYQKAFQQYADDADALALMGLIARQSGQWQAAIQLAARAVELRPGNAGFAVSLAEAYLSAVDPAAGNQGGRTGGAESGECGGVVPQGSGVAARIGGCLVLSW